MKSGLPVKPTKKLEGSPIEPKIYDLALFMCQHNV